MPTSRSGAGGKIVTSRRKQRISATPYDRPQQPAPPPSTKNPNWFTGIVVPSARALASGAGKIFSSIFSESESESSSSEDEDFASDDDINNDNAYKIPYNGVNTSNEENTTAMMQYGQESQLMWTRETKKIIEQLIMKETFSREECDRLIRLLNSRVMDWSMEAGEKTFVVGSPGKTVDHGDTDKAIQEAKKWFQEKKLGPNSVTELAQGESNLNSTVLEHVESGVGSPVDLARSYMKDRPPWTSPGRNVELRTPLTATMKLFKEGTSYSVGHDSTSTSKKRNSLASGSWNIHEELRRVRSRATEDMLRSPSTRTDPSLFRVAQTRGESAEAGENVFSMGQRMTELASLRLSKPVDAGVSNDPALAAFDSRLDGKSSETVLSKPAASVSGNNEILEAAMEDVECPASKLIHPSSPNHAEEQHADPHLGKVNGSPAAEVTEFGGNKSTNGLSSSLVGLVVEVAVGKNYEQRDAENDKADTSNEKLTDTTNVEGNCELLSEVYMEVPVVSETVASGSQNSLGEEVSHDIAQPSPKAKAGKQQGRRPSKYNRKSRGRGK
ncbi:hypothetical protein ACS0TY_011971 [Phlomoides rotata]